MKSMYRSATRFFLILVFVCIASIETSAAQSGGRLIVLRTPNFGWNLALNLQVDGRTVANVVQGRRYDHFVPAGRHVLTASAVPNYYFYQPCLRDRHTRPKYRMLKRKRSKRSESLPIRQSDDSAFWRACGVSCQ